MAFFNNNYQYKREERPRIQPGDYWASVIGVEDKVSSNGNDMLSITLSINGFDNLKVLHYIVQNEYADRNMTDFYDSFRIPDGNKNTLEWIGAIGAVRLYENDDGYMRIRHLLGPDKQDKLPPWSGEKPQRQTVTGSGDFDEIPDDNDLPF